MSQQKISRYANADIRIDGSILTITIDLDPKHVEFGPSKTGKSLIIATTGGATKVPFSQPSPSGNHTTSTLLSVNCTVYQPA